MVVMKTSVTKDQEEKGPHRRNEDLSDEESVEERSSASI